MLDWGALVTGENGPVLGHCPKHAPAISGDVGHTKPNNGGLLEAVPQVPQRAPSKKQEGEREAAETGAAGAAGPSNLCAEFSVSPVAVCLLVAYWDKVSGDIDELAGALAGLRSMQPAEQESGLGLACAEVGIDAWRVVNQQSNGEGQECSGCKHLVTRVASLPQTRCRYFWRCDLHYQVLEHYQGGKRVVIAPPDCRSWEWWKAGNS